MEAEAAAAAVENEEREETSGPRDVEWRLLEEELSVDGGNGGVCCGDGGGDGGDE